MANKRMYVGSAGIIAVVIFIYLGFFAPNPTGEDVSGTINTVQKYQNETIGDADVVLAGEEIILDELAELVEHATIDEQAQLLGKATQEMTSSIIGRCDRKIHAQMWEAMDKADQVASFEANTKNMEDVLGRAAMTMATFKRMDMDKKVATLHNATMEEKAAAFQRSPNRAKLAALGRMDIQGRAHVLMQGANMRDKAILAGRADTPTRTAMMARMDIQGRTRLVHEASLSGRAYLFSKTSEMDRQAMLQGATDVEKEALFNRLSIQDQIDATFGLMQMDKSFNILGRATDAELQNIHVAAPNHVSTALFGRLSVQKQDAFFKRVSTSREEFGKMTMAKQVATLHGANAAERREMLAKAELAEVQEIMGRLNIQDWQNILKRLETPNKAMAFERVTSKLQMQALGRAADIQAAFMGRVPQKVASAALERAYLDKPSVQ